MQRRQTLAFFKVLKPIWSYSFKQVQTDLFQGMEMRVRNNVKINLRDENVLTKLNKHDFYSSELTKICIVNFIHR